MSKSKFFRVATEGATTDGRNIDHATIEQIAATYNPKTYGARIWLEHIRGILPDSQFKAYGDVIAVKAEEVDTDSGKKLALFAQIEPTPELVAINKAKQKLYTSLEIQPDFADSAQPYLVGLGVTDSPASLGTEALQFSAGRKQQSTNLFTSAVEVTLEFHEPQGIKLADAVKNLLSRFSNKSGADAAQFADISEAVHGCPARRQGPGRPVAASGVSGGLANATSERLDGWRTGLPGDGSNTARLQFERLCDASHGVPGPVNGLWRSADWLTCRDGKWRPVEPGTFPLAHGAAARVGRLRAYGNAINAEQARIFIASVMEIE